MDFPYMYGFYTGSLHIATYMYIDCQICLQLSHEPLCRGGGGENAQLWLHRTCWDYSLCAPVYL